MNRPRRRHTNRRHGGPIILAPDHPAIREDRPLFPGMVRSATTVNRVLKSGSGSRKLGSHWSRSTEWRGIPIYSLTLPERSTCPASCPVRPCCYGNGMQLAPRFIPDANLLARLTIEIENLASVFPEGFSIRLHALGDFVSREYTQFWIDAVHQIPSVHCFGFTAHERRSEIGSLIEEESMKWDRFRIRFSGGEGKRSARVMDAPSWGSHSDGITCPADADHTDNSCGSCGLCLSVKNRIVFKAH